MYLIRKLLEGELTNWNYSGKLQNSDRFDESWSSTIAWNKVESNCNIDVWLISAILDEPDADKKINSIFRMNGLFSWLIDHGTGLVWDLPEAELQSDLPAKRHLYLCLRIYHFSPLTIQLLIYQLTPTHHTSIDLYLLHVFETLSSTIIYRYVTISIHLMYRRYLLSIYLFTKLVYTLLIITCVEKKTPLLLPSREIKTFQ